MDYLVHYYFQNEAAPLLNRNLLYTAITRAKTKVICLGRTETIRRMVKNDHVQRRYTALKSRLQEWNELL